jgi:hypothetical protein
MSLLNTTTNDSDARFVSADGDPQHAGFALKRRWERVHATSADGLMVTLNGVDTYLNPQADRQAYSGNFIQSALDPQARQDDAIDIQQTLTKVKAAVAESDADIVSTEGDPKAGGYKLNRAWHYINPYSLDTLLPPLNLVESVTNPMGNEETQTGKFVVSRVRSVEQNDRTYDILQDLVRVKTIASDTSLTDPLIDRAKDIIHPFGEGTGVGRDIIYRYINLDPASDTKLMAINDTVLVGKMSQNDSFIHAGRKSTTESDRTLTFWVLAQRKERISWGDTIYVNPDHVEDQNPSRDGTIRRKRWFGIDNDDYATVKAKLEASVDTNYSILSASLRDNDDGSDDWTQMSIKQFNDTQTDSRVLNTHGIEHNGIKTIHSDFDNYASEPATPVPSDTSYKPEQEKVWMDARGLISKRVIWSKPDASNDSASRSVLTNVRGGDQVELTAAGQRQQFTYDQVPLTDVATAMLALDTGDTNFVVADINYSDIGNGAAQIRRSKKLINSGSNFFIEEYGISNGNKSLRRTWPFVTDTVAVGLITPGGGASDTSFQYDGDSYLHVRSHRTKHYDGTSTVWEFGAQASTTVNIGGVAVRVGAGSDSELKHDYITEVSQEVGVITYQKVFKSFAAATAFAATSKLILTNQGIIRLGKVKLISAGQWLATAVVRA